MTAPEKRDMQHAQGHFCGSGGLELYYQSWRSEREPRAVVALVHGVGEHSGRYMNVVRPIVEAGHAVYGYDHRGHGSSPGPRVHIDRWIEYREDLGAYLSMIAEQMPGRPIVVYGHSMGSLVVLEYLLQRPSGLAGAIISGTAIEPAGVGGPLKVTMARVLSGLTPRLSVRLGIDSSALSRDPEALEAYLADLLVTDRATVRWGAESLSAVERVKDGMHRIDLPLLVLHGESDPLNLAEGSRALCEAVAHPGAELRIYPEVRHEPHNDYGHEQVALDITAWLDRLVDPAN